MPTAVLDLEYTALPEQVSGLERYQAARVLVRVAGEPAAWVWVPVVNGTVRAEAVQAALAAQGGPAFRQAAAVAAVRAWLGEAQAQDKDRLPQTAPTYCPATVAVCTRDRAEDLARCLAGIARLHADGQEVLVVDSASASDETRRVVERFPGVCYVRVERPGLDVARNAALAAARGEIVAFIDDDAVPDPNWLRAHLASFGQPLVMASLGLTLPLELETSAQEQFEAYSPFSRGLEAKVYDRVMLNPAAAAKAGAGVNLALRRRVVELVGPFDPALDAGTPAQSGGEVELLARLLAHSYRLVYTPAALNWHRHRRTAAELERTIYGYGVGIGACWTRLLAEGELTVPLLTANWLARWQLPRLAAARLGRKGAAPWPLPWVELRGFMAGPGAYRQARRAAEGQP